MRVAFVMKAEDSTMHMFNYNGSDERKPLALILLKLQEILLESFELACLWRNNLQRFAQYN